MEQVLQKDGTHSSYYEVDGFPVLANLCAKTDTDTKCRDRFLVRTRTCPGAMNESGLGWIMLLCARLLSQPGPGLSGALK